MLAFVKCNAKCLQFSKAQGRVKKPNTFHKGVIFIYKASTYFIALLLLIYIISGEHRETEFK